MVTLRPAQSTDLDFILTAELHPANAGFIGHWTRQQHEQALNDNNLRTQIIEDIDQRHVGYTILTGLESPHQTIQLQRLVITEKGKGYGRQALQHLKQVVFEQYHAHRFWLDVKDYNTRARRLYESEGFVIEGILRDCYKNGDQFESFVVLSMLAPEYVQQQTPG